MGDKDNKLLKAIIEYSATEIQNRIEAKRKIRRRRPNSSCFNGAMAFTLGMVTMMIVATVVFYFNIHKSTARNDNNALALYENTRQKRYDPDKIADYALESAGAEIFGEPDAIEYEKPEIVLFGLRIPFFMSLTSYGGMSSVLQPSKNPGECWAFAGDQGAIKVKLSHAIIPEAVTVDHIPSQVSPSGNIRSAPRNFIVFGFEGVSILHRYYLGQFEFKENGPSTQTFVLEQSRRTRYPIQIIEFQFLSNHGHPKYTCVYKLRVHGSRF